MLRVLVVDDEAGMVRLATRLLERAKDFRVVARASDGEQAIELARQHDVDLILLDIMMPKMSGLEALPHLRTIRPTARVILWSMLHDSDTLAKARQLGALACIDKSEDPIHLPTRLLGLLQNDSAGPGSIAAA